MKTYTVGLPIAGIAYVTVEADSEEAAIDAAMDQACGEHLEEWEPHRIMCEGNFRYYAHNEAWAECEDDDEELTP